MTFEDVDPSIFRTFVNWVYTNRVEFADGTTKLDDHNFEEALQTYIWADRYETIELCNALVDGFASHFQTQDIIPNTWELDLAFKNLPPNSGICRLFADLLMHGITARNMHSEQDFLKYIGSLPVETVGRILYFHITKKVGKEPDYWENRCSYHNHMHGEVCDNSFGKAKSRRRTWGE